MTRLSLERLERGATQALVAQSAQGKHLPAPLIETIVARTDGIPLYIEETTKALLASGRLRETEDAYELVGPVSDLTVPTSLHDSLMARLDRLPGVENIAQCAAVIGRSFTPATLAALSGLTAEFLAAGLRQLVEAELLFEQGAPSTVSYTFKHALVRDAAYGSLLKSSRLALHRRLLDIFEREHTVHAEVMAQHAEAAGLPERALEYWTEAGIGALAKPAYGEAAASFEHAIALCRAIGDAPAGKRREQALQVRLGQALLAYRGYADEATRQAFERGRELR